MALIKVKKNIGKPQKQAIIMSKKPMNKMDTEDMRDMKKGIKQTKKEEAKEGKDKVKKSTPKKR